MGKPEFTKMQKLAIDIRDKNILVSAAAGSGKTAVLVERIINRILDKDNPVDIDRILVMTFTKAAAAQMKEKILNAIDEKKAEDPTDKNLSRQYALVHNASIMTIDSFCMNVVKNHFEEINLSPDFRLADEGEMRLLKQDVLEELLEKCYEEADENFLNMTEVFSSKKTDLNIESMLLSLYGYSQSYPDPHAWLDECTKEYEESKNPSWLENYVDSIRIELTRARNSLDEAGDICKFEYGPLAYLQNIERELEFTDSLLGFNSYEELYDKCNANSDFTYDKLKTIRALKEGDADPLEIEERNRLKEKVQKMRNSSKSTVQAILESVCALEPKDISKGMNMMKYPVNELVKLTKEFDFELSEKKRQKNIVDFNDVEHMCLEILRKGQDEYRNYFEEIYVDEYQDSNFVQEEILGYVAKNESDKGNVFMVGDVKQSIYGFRMAKPEIFVGKYDRFEKISENEETDSRDVRIDLSDNFRSRKEVLSSVNALFEKVMNKEFGGIEYDDAAALHAGRQYIETESNCKTELNFMLSDPDIDDKDAEALMVSNRIKDLILNHQIEDNGKLRPVKYSDIVILLRTAKGWDNVFMSRLTEQGIPVFVTSSTGYFESIEIKTILNYLRIIDNPLQDIPLASVLMSVIGNFTEEEIAIIRAEFKDGYLFDALINYKNAHDSMALVDKVESFLNQLDYYRGRSGYMAVSEILTEIIDGDYGKIIKAMPAGNKKYANLNMLLKKAQEYGKTSYKGIFHFNRYIEAIRKYDIDYGEANISDENDNAVRIMSIHKSKGLEFPVCFVCGMNKKINMMDTRSSVLTDSKYGVATDFIDIKRRIRAKSPFKTVVADKKKAEIIAEEMRILYVAMTRAKEKLIMTASIKDEKAIDGNGLTPDKISSYLDMYLCAREQGDISEIETTFNTVKDIVNYSVNEAVKSEISRNRLLSIIGGKDKENSENAEMLKRRFDFVYPYVDKGNVKVSVSELKHRSQIITDDSANDDVDVTETKKYDYVKGMKSKAALHGTAIHRIFEIWDYSLEPTRDSVTEFLKYVSDEKLMEEDLFELVRADEVYDFISSDIAIRMGKAFKAGKLHREQPFVICDDKNDPDSMLVQGIIDAYFEEDGKIILVDYKTDRGKSEKELKEDHYIQLGYYADAIKRLLNMEVSEKIIYSTYLKKSILI